MRHVLLVCVSITTLLRIRMLGLPYQEIGTHAMDKSYKGYGAVALGSVDIILLC